ncbi:MAG TPA: LysR family transcriptional regulator [Acetobacteraceae bacterium]|nr:LysR family transcriptional regulator [Acetobacteraceae bacterium]
MDRDLLAHLPVILAIADRGGFAAAAASLGMSPSAISHSVRLVEERLGVPLFARTTRSVALTEAGKVLVEGAGPALRDIAERLERVRAVKGRATGLLRINAPSIAPPMVLTDIVRRMTQDFPDVRVEIAIDNAIADIVAEGFDAGIRLGEMIAEDMVAVRLTPPFKAVIVAAPSYLAAHGRPETIADLPRHDCIAFRRIRSGGLYAWELRENGRDVAIESRGSVIVNDALHARDLALAGIGLAYLFEPLVRADIAAGRLAAVLPQAAIEEPGLFLYFPRRAALAPKLRAFIDTAKRVTSPAARGTGIDRPIRG